MVPISRYRGHRLEFLNQDVVTSIIEDQYIIALILANSADPVSPDLDLNHLTL